MLVPDPLLLSIPGPRQGGWLSQQKVDLECIATVDLELDRSSSESRFPALVCHFVRGPPINLLELLSGKTVDPVATLQDILTHIYIYAL